MRNLQKKLQNTEVEEVQSTLQFSTSVEVRPGNVTSSQLQLRSGLVMLPVSSQLQLRSGLGMLPVC